MTDLTVTNHVLTVSIQTTEEMPTVLLYIQSHQQRFESKTTSQIHSAESI